ncbi:shikimate 5-dehydrogenase [Nakamurella sp. YIM 132084]|uniref:Shikimate 5-dehydrogenase n=1 Tax=Nakamurella leprariae TaxID=2803911 RepID=A0A939BZF0_9ACTN|nr:shikimate 5-dehydrogenase [Nakamurella leprariae]
MVGALTKDTRLCISLAGRPSNIGTRFHNHLYDELGLDFVYKAFTTTDIAAAVAGIRALGIRGAGVSMPFKQACLDLVDHVDPSAAGIEAVNTIVNDDGVLRAFNTDYLAVAQLLRERGLRELIGAFAGAAGPAVAVAGSGGMATAVAAALRDSGFDRVLVVARNEAAGRALARRCGGTWAPELGAARPGLLVNATPVGMAGGVEADELPFPAEAVDAAAAVFDVVAVPSMTPFVRRAADRGVPVVTGADVIAVQAAEQFVLYTGVRPTAEQIRRASEWSRR